MSLRRSLRSRPVRDDPPDLDSNASPRTPTRVTRAVASSSVTVFRAPSDSPEESRRSIRLTVKMPSSKLREVTSSSTRNGASRRSVNVFTENPIVTGPRTSRPKKKLVEVDTSDEDLDDQEEDEVDDEDAPGEDDEDVDADGDLDMDDAPPQPPVSKRHAKSTASTSKAAKGIEAKEMELDADDDEDDEELSDPESDAEGEPDDQEESGIGNVNGGDEDLDEDDEEDDEDLDSDDDTPTADPARMTKRQRGNLGNDFLQLPMEPQVKKHLTAEERAMRRAEMARRRKNLSEKRNEEEKMDTINRLLRKQAPKRRGRIPAAEAAETASAEQQTQEFERLDPAMVRWISGREGSKVIVSEEWLGTPAGRVFGKPSLESSGPRKLVEEV